jgi:hypothetical protein
MSIKIFLLSLENTNQKAENKISCPLGQMLFTMPILLLFQLLPNFLLEISCAPLFKQVSDPVIASGMLHKTDFVNNCLATVF